MKQFKEMKFRVRDEEHSKQIQDVLFGMGYKWGSCSEVQNLNAPYLYARSSGGIGASWGYAEGFFEQHSTQEYQLIAYTTYTLEEVPSPVISQETVELNGQVYLKADLEEALSKLKPVVENV